MVSRIVLVGIAPGPSHRGPHVALHPGKPGSAGARLASIMGLTPEEYLRKFDRTNVLCEPVGKWGIVGESRVARNAATCMLPLLAGRDVVFLGADVARAFGRKDLTFHSWEATAYEGLEKAVYAALVPHPSGRNRWYNDPANFAEAREFWKETLR